nr:EAL domain-containing protein [Halomonas cerina]
MAVLALSFLLALSLALIALGQARERQLAATQERFRSLFTHHPDAVYEFDLAGLFVNGNEALTRITGHPLPSLIGRHFNAFIEEESRATTQASFDAAAAGQGQHYETRGIHASGRPYMLEVTNLPIIVDERVVGVYGICRDVTRRKAHEEQLRLLKRAIEASPNGIIIADALQADLPLVYVNETFCTLTGYAKEEALGRNCRFLQGPDTDPEALATIRAAFADRTDVQVILRNYRQDGTPFWNQLFIGPVLDASGRCTHLIGIQQDITQHREYEARLSYQETHDLLTGLPNRQYFETRLEHAYLMRQRQPRELVVLYIDLDGFKPINDGLGHQVGDQLLVAVAKRLKALLRADDALVRLGGDEFAIALYHLDEPCDATGVAERVLRRLAVSFEIGEQVLHISASIGLASSREHAGGALELIQQADLAMQEAKAQGGNTWQWHGGDDIPEVGEHVALRRELQEAIHSDQFEVYYQPIVDSVTGRLRSIEALIRWHHPTHGLVSPGRFIPLAEKTGQIVAIGQWVLRRACRDMAALQAAGGSALPVAVNISPLQFRRAGFLDNVKAVLEDTGLPPARLELEVTEGMLMTGTRQAIERLTALRALGVQVAIDDFGTGFSSLAYLRQLPINKIKLDRSFIHDLTTNRDNAAIVQGIITMAHHLNLVVVAEGVETRELQEELMRRHCDLLQGFFFSRPVCLAELEALPDRLPAAQDLILPPGGMGDPVRA